MMRAMVSGNELADLAPERVWQEVQRALHEQAPGVFFDVLRELGALDQLIPELADTDTFAKVCRACTAFIAGAAALPSDLPPCSAQCPSLRR